MFISVVHQKNDPLLWVCACVMKLNCLIFDSMPTSQNLDIEPHHTDLNDLLISRISKHLDCTKKLNSQMHVLRNRNRSVTAFITQMCRTILIQNRVEPCQIFNRMQLICIEVLHYLAKSIRTPPPPLQMCVFHGMAWVPLSSCG